jgi:hypothetical protein
MTTQLGMTLSRATGRIHLTQAATSVECRPPFRPIPRLPVSSSMPLGVRYPDISSKEHRYLPR